LTAKKQVLYTKKQESQDVSVLIRLEMLISWLFAYEKVRMLNREKADIWDFNSYRPLIIYYRLGIKIAFNIIR